MVSEGWYIGGGGFVKSPLLWRLLFVLFLPTQEKNIFSATINDHLPALYCKKIVSATKKDEHGCVRPFYTVN
jgi:hypothetical protein